MLKQSIKGWAFLIFQSDDLVSFAKLMRLGYLMALTFPFITSSQNPIVSPLFGAQMATPLY
jgi:hypothetical protein